MRMHPSSPTAFTLIELLVVITIIAVLAGMTLAAVGTVRESAKRTQCAGNQRMIGMAIVSYSAGNEGLLPAMLVSAAIPWGSAGGYGDNTWMHQLVGEYELAAKSFDCPAGKSLGPAIAYPWMGSAIPTYSCPNGAVEYTFNGWLGTGADNFGHGSGTGSMSAIQAPSVTLLVGEGRYPSFHDAAGYWTNVLTGSLARGHSRGMNVLCCDGHVEYARVGDASRGLRWTANASWDAWYPNPESRFW